MRRIFVWAAFFSLLMTACLETLDEPKEIECLFGTVFFNGTCIPVDNEHCGNPKQAFKACGENQVCKSIDYNYVCVCKEEFMTCGKDAALCQTNVYNDRHNCGKCGKECPVELECYKGKCTCLDINKNVVTDFTTNENCGKCGFKCPNGSSCHDGICSCGEYENGKLMATCEADKVCETNLWNDVNHCGKCDNACPPSDGEKGAAVCKSGKCECSTGLILCNGQCVRESDEQCGARCEACLDGSKCEGAEGSKFCKCPGNKIYCEGRCVDSDDMNCGACGKKCSETERCLNNKCECKENYTKCGDRCVDPLRDKAYCGSIGAKCSDLKNCDFEIENYGICVNGKCNELKCPDGIVAGKSDPKHCGEACKVCKENEGCFIGKCSRCEAPNKACGALCVDIRNNNEHCGDCNKKCGANMRCEKGKCVCAEGFVEKYHYVNDVKIVLGCVQNCDGNICAPGSVCTESKNGGFFCYCADSLGVVGDRCPALSGYACDGRTCGCVKGYTKKIVIKAGDGGNSHDNYGCFPDCDGVKCAENTYCVKLDNPSDRFRCRCTDGHSVTDICTSESGVCGGGGNCRCKDGYFKKYVSLANDNIAYECSNDCNGKSCMPGAVCDMWKVTGQHECVCHDANNVGVEMCTPGQGVCEGSACTCQNGYVQKFVHTDDNLFINEGCAADCEGVTCAPGAACIKEKGKDNYTCHCIQKKKIPNNINYSWERTNCNAPRACVNTKCT